MKISPRILLFGDIEHSDFVALRQWLGGESGAIIETQLDSQAVNDLVVLFQSRPGQFSQDDVESLHRRFPLARLLAVLGTWCEGEQRTGHPWHGVERVYWYNAVARIRAMLADCDRISARTETLAERINHQTKHRPTGDCTATALIFSSRNDYEALSDMCRVLGMTPQRCSGLASLTSTPQYVFLVGDDLASVGGSEWVAAVRKACPLTRIVAVLNFPRAMDVAVLRRAGCDTVLGKPFLLADIVAS